MFQAYRKMFDEVLDLISPIVVEHNAVEASNSPGRQISSKTGLLLCWDGKQVPPIIYLCFCWGISIGTFYNKDRGPIWPTREAINLAFDIGLPLHDTRQLDELAKGFYDNREEMITGKGASLKKLSPIVANRKKHSPAKKSLKDWPKNTPSPKK